MDVAHVITSLGQGGAEAMLEKIILAARDETPSVRHRVISLRNVDVVGARLRDVGIQVDALHMDGPLASFKGFFRLVGMLRRAPPQTVVQTWLYHADLIGGLAARLAGRTVVWNIRQTGLGHGDISRATHAIVRACGLLSRRIPARILCNATAAIEAHARLGYDTGRFQVIPNGFDTNRFKRDETGAVQVRAAWGLRDNEIAVGLVARLDPQKDHATFVRAAAIAAAGVPALRFVLIGRGVPDSTALHTAIAKTGLEKRFVLEGQRSDIARVMSALDVFCLSSRAEGFPNVLGEAMACQTPSVSTDCGDARFVLGDDARIAPIQDAPALAARITELAALPAAQRRAVGAQQRERIVRDFDIRQVWNAYLALYTRLAGEKNSTGRAN